MEHPHLKNLFHDQVEIMDIPPEGGINGLEGTPLQIFTKLRVELEDING